MRRIIDALLFAAAAAAVTAEISFVFPALFDSGPAWLKAAAFLSIGITIELVFFIARHIGRDRSINRGKKDD